jgi:hypothetical protein
MAKIIIIYFILGITFLRSSIVNTLVPVWLIYGLYTIISIILIIFFLIERKLFSLPMLFFIFIAFISIVFNEINEIFNSWQRLGSFIIIIIAVGPLLQNKTAINFKISLHKHANIFLIIITVISFLLYFVSTSVDKNILFTGLADSSMTLGPIASLSSLICLDYFIISRNKIEKGTSGVLMIISLLVSILAASRGAIGALFISVMLYLVVYFRKSIIKLLGIILIILLCLICSSSLWMPYSKVLVEKNQSRIDSDNIFSNRQLMMIDGLDDFLSNPFWGVGFSSMKNIKNSKFNGNGTFEPPSGWLFLLSSMGLLGFLTFCKLIFPYIFRTVKSGEISKTHSLLLAVILFYFCIHMFIEGYVLSSGGFLFFYLWLSIGLVQKKTSLNTKKVKLFKNQEMIKSNYL